jgi:hypothetical protein
VPASEIGAAVVAGEMRSSPGRACLALWPQIGVTLLTSALPVYLGPGPGRLWRSAARGGAIRSGKYPIREALQSAGVFTIEGIASLLSAATLNLLRPTMRPAGAIYETVLVCRVACSPP